MVLVGYIDESSSGEVDPKTFALGCLYTTGSLWSWVELAWRKACEEKNDELAKAGRKQFKRFHAVDINNYKKDFDEWDGEERTEFTKVLLKKVFALHDLFFRGYTINLQELGTLWPETRDYLRPFAYNIMLRLMMIELGSIIKEDWPKETKAILIHERCESDAVLLNAFNRSIREKPEHAQIFASITPMGWENCIPLQPADFVAYESMKETHRTRPGQKTRNRRQSLTALLELDSIGASCEEIPREAILEWKQMADQKIMERIKAEADASSV